MENMGVSQKQGRLLIRDFEQLKLHEFSFNSKNAWEECGDKLLATTLELGGPFSFLGRSLLRDSEC